MSWWGKKEEPAPPSYSASNSSSDFGGSQFQDSSSFAAPSSGFGGGGGGGSMQEQLAMEQQKMQVQQVMFKLTDLAFDSCVNKPSSSLSSSETNCIEAVVGKYVDSSAFIMQKFGGGQR